WGIYTLATDSVSGKSSRTGRFLLWPAMVFLSGRAEVLLPETADPRRPRNLPFLADSPWIAQEVFISWTPRTIASAKSQEMESSRRLPATASRATPAMAAQPPALSSALRTRYTGSILRAWHSMV